MKPRTQTYLGTKIIPKPIDPWYFEQLPPLLIKVTDKAHEVTKLWTRYSSSTNTDKDSRNPQKDRKAPKKVNFQDLRDDEKELLCTRIVNTELSMRAKNVLRLREQRSWAMRLLS